MRRLLFAALLLSMAITVIVPTSGAAASPLRIGALFPLSGSQSSLAQQEYRGVEIAAAMANQEGGVNGRPIQLVTQQLDTLGAVSSAIASLRAAQVPAIIGTYSSSLSIPASAAAAADGITYWEAGAVADQVTGRGLPEVFRVGATGSELGDNSANFATTVLAPKLSLQPQQVRVSVVYEGDAYGSSVGIGAAATASADHLDVVSVTSYNAYAPNWDSIFATLDVAHPTVVILASYILDGVQFRQQMLARHFHTDALIGSTMAECGPEYGNLLGTEAVGVFASDRPTAGFNAYVLDASAFAAYSQFVQQWQQLVGGAPTEEGIAGFTAGWALFHFVLPRAHGFTSLDIAAAARSTVLPEGSLPNGAGLDFSKNRSTRGQNLDAAAVIWQWQSSDGHVWATVVWPPAYATGTVTDVPLPE